MNATTILSALIVIAIMLVIGVAAALIGQILAATASALVGPFA